MDSSSPASLRLVAPSADERRGLLIASAVVVAALCALILAELGDYSLRVLAPVTLLVVGVAVSYRRLFAWRSLVGLIVLVILFIPIRRYTLPSSLPFHLEPYRLVVALVCAAWLTSLLIDRRIRLRRTPVDAPLLAFAAAIILSLFANRARVASVQPDVIKSLLFFASFFLVVYVVSSVIRRRRDLDLVVKLLAGGGTVVAVCALFESYTGYNVFNHLRTVAPFLQQTAVTVDPGRGARLRVFASAQHPIALSCALTMLAPLAAYLAIATGRRRWWGAAILLFVGGLSAIARTDLTVVLAVVVVYVWLRPRHMKRLWPALIPMVIVVHFALPGAIGSFKSSLFPRGGLFAQEAKNSVGSGRLATAPVVLRNEFRPDPLFGEGFSTRVVTPDEFVQKANAPILDDEMLGVLVETGLLGAFALAWLFVRFVRRLAHEARCDKSPRGWLLTGLAASVAGYGVSMFTYDSFAFIQVTFLLFVFLGLGAAALRLDRDAWAEGGDPERVRAHVRRRPLPDTQPA
ncbi:MAG: O-antigen ligase family protein [Gaiellaceae bacterium]